jgi:hypothetical protein
MSQDSAGAGGQFSGIIGKLGGLAACKLCSLEHGSGLVVEGKGLSGGEARVKAVLEQGVQFSGINRKVGGFRGRGEGVVMQQSCLAHDMDALDRGD